MINFVVIIGRGYDNKGLFYRFYDVGTSYKEKGESDENKLHKKMVCYKENLHTIQRDTMSQPKYAETYLAKRVKMKKLVFCLLVSLLINFTFGKEYIWQ